MTELKYNTLKNAISELSGVYKEDSAMQALTEIVAEVDKLEVEKPTPTLTKSEILAEKNPTKRLGLINDNMELFKGGK